MSRRQQYGDRQNIPDSSSHFHASLPDHADTHQYTQFNWRCPKLVIQACALTPAQSVSPRRCKSEAWSSLQ